MLYDGGMALGGCGLGWGGCIILYDGGVSGGGWELGVCSNII